MSDEASEDDESRQAIRQILLNLRSDQVLARYDSRGGARRQREAEVAADEQALHAVEAIRLLNESLPEMPYSSDFDFELYGDISFQHYEQVLGGWAVHLLENARQNASLLNRVFALVETLATSGDQHYEALISAGFCEELACGIPRAALRAEARALMGPRTLQMFDAEIATHGWDDAWAAEWYGKSWLSV